MTCTRILHWFSRISDAADSGSEVIGLVPVATNTAHWKRHVYIDGVEDPKGAPMSCAVIYWGQNPDTFAESFQEHGAVVSLVGTRLPEAELSLFA